MKIQVLTDDRASWFVPYGEQLTATLASRGYDAVYVFDKRDIVPCEILFMLSCGKLVPQQVLVKNQHNIVVHASDLPAGKGFSPLQWQILEGRNMIALTLFEAVVAVDAGPVYLKDAVAYDGTELYDELRAKLGNKIVEMCIRYADEHERLPGVQQRGESTFYRRRTAADDELDVNKTLAELFDHLRIADSERHPVWFRYRGASYCLRITRRQGPST
jgi:methionyl-tRNA formyltransferase